MVESTTERGRKVSALAQRLRLVQADLADQDEDLRNDTLREEVQRVLAGVSPGDRESFLHEVMQRFPVMGAESAPGPAPAAQAAPEPRDPKALADRLIEASRALSDADKMAIAAKLRAAGLAVKEVVQAAAPAAAPKSAGAPQTLPDGPLGELRRTVRMNEGAALNGQRAAELVAALAEFAVKIEPWACTYWKQVAPGAQVQMHPVLERNLHKFLSGDESVTKDMVANSLYNLRSLVSLLMRSAVEAGGQSARDHIARFGVQSITERAPRKYTESSDASCWKQYVRDMQEMDAAAIERRFVELMARDVDARLAQVVKKDKVLK